LAVFIGLRGGTAIEGIPAMPRPPRLRIAGATYHVVSRGNRRGMVFFDDRDRRRFLRLVRISIARYGAVCYGYCLMGNHYHLVIYTTKPNISFVVGYINARYAEFVNWRYGWTGHVFGERFKAPLIGDDQYLRNALVYVARNPVEAGLVKDAGDWTWSHYRAVMGTAAPAPFLNIDWLSTLFPQSTIAESREMFRLSVVNYCEEERDSYAKAFRVSNEFQHEIRSVIGSTLYRAALPKEYRALGRPALAELFGGVRKKDRREQILRAHVVHGYQMSEIARCLDLHPSTVSRIVNRKGSYGRIKSEDAQ
jgi:REP element-mobilizing transposase RayT